MVLKRGKYLKFVSLFMNIYHVREGDGGRGSEEGRVKGKGEGEDLIFFTTNLKHAFSTNLIKVAFLYNQ